MADASDAQARLASLRRRWEADPASRVFLQLAEEYRRLGHLTEAVEVIEGGLRHHPSYLSAHVALARCRVELGDFELAEPTLRKVLAQDPTQMVAMKLLVQSYLGQGRTADAADWLARYELLAVNDDDIALLRARVSARAGAAAHLPEQPSSPVAVGPSEPTVLAEDVNVAFPGGPEPTATAGAPSASRPPRREGLLFELPALAGPPLDLASLSRPGRSRLPAHVPAGLPEPFPHLYSDLPRRLGDGELFRAPPATVVPAAEAAAPTSLPTQDEVDWAPEPPGAAGPAAPGPAAPESSAPPEPPAMDTERAAGADLQVEPALAALDAAGEVGLVLDVAPRAQGAEAELALPVVAPFVAPPDQAAPPADSTPPEEIVSSPVALESWTAPAAMALPGAVESLEASGTLAAPAADTATATVTLADLHSQQGYLDDAEDLYRQVLAREPWNTKAAAGLRQVALRRPPPLDALSLLRGFRSTGGGLTAKKTHVLRSYLEQLRRRG